MTSGTEPRVITTRSDPSSSWKWSLALFALVLVVHGLSPVVQTGDSYLSTAVATSVVRDGDMYLDEFPLVREPGRTDVAVLPDGHVVWTFPWAPALTLVPLVAVLDVGGVDLTRLAQSDHVWIVQKPLAAMVTALAAVVLFFVASRVLSGDTTRRRRRAAAASLVFAFATPAWSTASMALHSHTPALLLVACALMCAVHVREEHAWWWASALGACAALAATMRPTSAVIALAFAVWVLVAHPRRFPALVAGAVTVAVAWLAVNDAVFGTALPSYFSAGRLTVSGTTGPALLGVIVSPGRGLLLFTPVVLLALSGFLLKSRRRAPDGISVVCVVALVVQWLTVAMFPHWWGGAGFGQRFVTEFLPLLFWLSLPFVDRVSFSPAVTRSQRALAIVASALIVVSFLVAAQGALLRSSWCWNRLPVHVDAAPNRVWYWGDPQFARGIRVLAGAGVREAVLQRCIS